VATVVHAGQLKPVLVVDGGFHDEPTNAVSYHSVPVSLAGNGVIDEYVCHV
jgi:hypothetical protein